MRVTTPTAAATTALRGARVAGASHRRCSVRPRTGDIGDRSQETSYGRTHDLLHGDGPPCPRSAGHGGGGINSIVVGRAASSQTLASFPVTLFSTSVRELER